jgi:pentatricopeptide repeat protein
VCAKAADAETAFECYGQMRERGVRPDREVYATLIDACTRRIARTAPSDR